MKNSKVNGKNSLKSCEIISITKFGIWLFFDEKEYYICFSDFPFFENATLNKIYNFEFFHGHHLHWPELNIDISLHQLNEPHRWPLIQKN